MIPFTGILRSVELVTRIGYKALNHANLTLNHLLINTADIFTTGRSPKTTILKQ